MSTSPQAPPTFLEEYGPFALSPDGHYSVGQWGNFTHFAFLKVNKHLPLCACVFAGARMFYIEVESDVWLRSLYFYYLACNAVGSLITVTA